jgi:hypothetical protein
MGSALSPFTGALSTLRKSRMFHPRGLVCRAEVEAAPADPSLQAVAEALAGVALVRWSSALWKRGEWTDVLGCALRFAREPLSAEARADDQDLLLATIQRPWSMPLAPFTTRTRDFLDNVYYGVSPFEVDDLGRVEWRVISEYPAAAGDDRQDRLARAMRDGHARLRLELAPYPGPLSRPDGDRFKTVVRLNLTQWLELDQEALRFDPFRSGRGLRPVGFVHAMRRATYAASQRGRPAHTPDQGTGSSKATAKFGCARPVVEPTNGSESRS